MGQNELRAEILANGLVQGVGFRYFVVINAEKLNLKGYVKNLYTGEVLTVIEGTRHMIEALFDQIKIGPRSGQVRNATITWEASKNEFTTFEVRY